MELLKQIDAEISLTADVLARGGVVAYPTDTVWGLGCDASNPEAVARLYKLKERPAGKAMLVLVDGPEMLVNTVGSVPDPVMRLMTASNRPVTVIFPAAHGVAPNLVADDGSLGIRITREQFSRELCRRLGAPVVSTSANFSGAPAPACFDDIDPLLLERLDYVPAAGRNLPPAIPSMIVKLNEEGSLSVIRG